MKNLSSRHIIQICRHERYVLTKQMRLLYAGFMKLQKGKGKL